MIRLVFTASVILGVAVAGCAELQKRKELPAVEMLVGKWERVSPIGGMVIEMSPGGIGRIGLQGTNGVYSFGEHDRAFFTGGDKDPQLKLNYSNGSVPVDTTATITLLTENKLTLQYTQPATYEEEYERKK